MVIASAARGLLDVDDPVERLRRAINDGRVVECTLERHYSWTVGQSPRQLGLHFLPTFS